MIFFKKIKFLIDENRGYNKNNLLFNQNLIAQNKKIITQNEELIWANIYHDSIRGKEPLEKLALNIGRWAGSYVFFYILNRILIEYQPKNILEFGLGESSKMVSNHLEYYLLNSNHLIIEHNPEWKKKFQNNFNLNARSKIEICELQKIVVDGYNVNNYSGLEEKINSVFDLYIIDGPFGSDHFSRFDIVSIASKFSSQDEFIIIMDDFDRSGEQETINVLEKILIKKNIKVFKGIYSGVKNVCVIGTQKYKYVQSL